MTSADEGIRGKDYLVIHNWNITVNARGDGLKSDNEDHPSLGFITIDNVTANITSSTDAISAQTDLYIADGK